MNTPMIVSKRVQVDGRQSIPWVILLALLIGLVALAQPAGADTFQVVNTNNTGAGSLRQAIDDANAHPGLDTITFAAGTNGTPIVLTGDADDNGNASGDLDILDGGDLLIQGNGTANTIIDGGGVDRVFHICPAKNCSSTVTLSGLTIQNGVVAGGGGGIRHEAGTAIVDDSLLRANGAINGGGISNFATLIIQNNSVIGEVGGSNHAVFGNGGGIYNFDGSLTIDHSTVSTNTAGVHGGGIWNQVTLNVENGATIGGSGAGNLAGTDGGGIYNASGGTTTVNASTVSDNTAEDGGGIYHYGGVLTVENGSAIGDAGAGAGNTATVDGGGVFVRGGTVTVDASTVSANSADNSGGGIWNQATLNVINGSAIGEAGAPNQAIGGNGGGIFNVDPGSTTVDSSTVSGNSAQAGGGMNNSDSGVMTVDASTVSDNTADLWGGGITNRGTLNIMNGSTISGNEAGIMGGGICSLVDGSTQEGTTTVENSTVSGNTAVGSGGGIYNFMGDTTLNGSAVNDNGAQDGGGIYNDNLGVVTVSGGSTISGNTADLHGGGIHNGSGFTTMTGSRLLHNSATGTGGGLYNDLDSAGAADVTGSCIVGNSAMSFYNNQTAEQIATGNWWGAATGPNTAGADSVLGNVDVSDHLTEPILNCAPDLEVSKTNDTDGAAIVDVPFNWVLTISNTGLVSATYQGGQAILVDQLPGGPTYGAPLVRNLVDVVGGAHIDCSLAGNTLTCGASGGPVTIGMATGRFEVSFSVTPHAEVTLVNPAGLCQVDPDGLVTEGDEGDNNCPADVVDVVTWNVYLPLVSR